MTKTLRQILRYIVIYLIENTGPLMFSGISKLEK
ncbi:MAG: hypothetical protein ACJAVD_001091 [Porticoccaceae bacterium]|jgi:hypothetical protein